MSLTPTPAMPSTRGGDLTFTPTGLPEIPTIQRLAHLIWPVTYAAILNQAQIELMLCQMYATDTLQADVTQRGYAFDLAWHGGEAVGYLAYRTQAEGCLLLSKCYLHPDLHGRGLGQRLLDRVDVVARGRGLATIELYVNRRNHRALTAYLRHGYQIASTVATPLPGGFVMDDYRMNATLPVSP